MATHCWLDRGMHSGVCSLHYNFVYFAGILSTTSVCPRSRSIGYVVSDQWSFVFIWPIVVCGNGHLDHLSWSVLGHYWAHQAMMINCLARIASPHASPFTLARRIESFLWAKALSDLFLLLGRLERKESIAVEMFKNIWVIRALFSLFTQLMVRFRNLDFINFMLVQLFRTNISLSVLHRVVSIDSVWRLIPKSVADANIIHSIVDIELFMQTIPDY